MRGWIFVGLITGVVFGGAAALVAWIFAMPLGITVRVVALAFPLGIALEWVTVRARGVESPIAFVVIAGLAVLLFLQVRDVSSGPRFVRQAEDPAAPAAGVGGGGDGGGSAVGPAPAAAAQGGGARIIEPRPEESDRDGEASDAAASAPATLLIRNPTDATLRLWIVDSGGRSRLGRLRAGNTSKVRVRASEPSIVIEVRGPGGGYTMPVAVAPGATLDIALVPPG
jgi:hypothetical protein